MRIRLPIALFLLMLAATQGSAADAASRWGKIIVTIKDENGRGLPGVTFQSNGAAKRTAANGLAKIKAKAGRRYTLIFSAFEDYSLIAPAAGRIVAKVRAAKVRRISAVYRGRPALPPEICSRPVDLVDTSSPDHIVGDGTPESCTEAALGRAIAAGGVITFNCGSAPVTISITSEKKISKDVVLDGADLITLDGGGRTRLLNMDTGNFEASSPRLTAQRLAFRHGRARGSLLEGSGGAIYYRGGSVTVINCIFSENSAEESGPDVGGGAIYGIGVGETIVVGSQFIANRGSSGGAIGALHTALTVVNSTLTDNWAGGGGGALYMDGVGRKLTLCGSRFENNSAGMLGGVLFRTGYRSEPSIIDRCSIDGNSVRRNSNQDEANGGGALYIQGTTVTLRASTISNNAARSFAGVWILGHGDVPAVANLTNVTISGNYTYPQETIARGIGGGLIIGDRTSGTISNCTIVNNTAQFASGIANASPLTIKNSIISNNADNVWTPLNCTGSNYDKSPARGHSNVQWPSSGKQSDMDCVDGITRTDPMMGPLQDNGGTMRTTAPLPGSPALNGGVDCEPVDQLGRSRAAACTLGALE